MTVAPGTRRRRQRGDHPRAARRPWAEAERAGFASVGVVDRLVYDNLEPLTALAAAAACTQHIELFTTVLNVAWRANPGAARQADGLSRSALGWLADRGAGTGWWPEDFVASDVPTSGKAPGSNTR